MGLNARVKFYLMGISRYTYPCCRVGYMDIPLYFYNVMHKSTFLYLNPYFLK